MAYLPKKGENLYCSFCGLSEHDAVAMVAGPSVFICDQCIALCQEIMQEVLPSLLAERETSQQVAEVCAVQIPA